ncbi:MAG: hypothetical protein WCT99_11345 [Bacteroidota bacterium]|jgi:hypothetical protein
MKIILFAALLVSGLICDLATNPKEVAPGEEFELKYRETVRIHDTNLSLTFSSLKEDSRCPEGAVCVWAGNAKIGMTADAVEFELNTTLEPAQAQFSGYTITLIAVSPYPKLNGMHKPEDYSARLIVSR